MSLARAIRQPNAAEQQLKKEVAKQLNEERSILMMLQPFTASLAMRLNMKVVVDDRLPTAATDGETLFFNAHFMQQRSADDRRFIIAHEVWHCVLAHSVRKMAREHNLWNQAADYELNHILHDEMGFHPQDALYSKHFRNLNAEEIYSKLAAQQQAKPNRKFMPTPLDEHDIWEVLTRSGTVFDPDFTPRTQPSTHQQQTEAHDWQVATLIAAKSMQPGSLPSSIQRLLEGISQPSVPWQRVLERFLQRQSHGDQRQWLPPARRHIHRGLYMPSLRGSRLQAAVAIDTSGSCHHELGTFISELKSILGGFNQVELTVLCFDVAVHTTMQLTHNDLHQLDNLTMKAGGGTSFQPVFDELEKYPTPEALIFFTDGYARAPQNSPNYPVLWVLTEDGQKPAEWGEEVWVG